MQCLAFPPLHSLSSSTVYCSRSPFGRAIELCCAGAVCVRRPYEEPRGTASGWSPWDQARVWGRVDIGRGSGGVRRAARAAPCACALVVFVCLPRPQCDNLLVACDGRLWDADSGGVEWEGDAKDRLGHLASSSVPKQGWYDSRDQVRRYRQWGWAIRCCHRALCRRRVAIRRGLEKSYELPGGGKVWYSVRSPASQTRRKEYRAPREDPIGLEGEAWELRLTRNG